MLPSAPRWHLSGRPPDPSMKRIEDAAAAGDTADTNGRAAYLDFSFSATLVSWQREHGRHALPWQNTRDPYRIWISEIMLQQTQVAAVIPYYLRFLERFPDLLALAAAPSDDVMAHWSGLGYYSRARNLHRCAQQLVAVHGAVFPRDPEKLVALPGIGRSTAAAIAAFAFGARAAILDGNVKRVLCRVFGVEGFPGLKAVEDALWERALALMPEQGIESYTQGLMDLGATLCTRARPGCGHCPLAARCVALASGRVNLLPTPRHKKTIPQRSIGMLVIEDGEHVLLEQRPDSGIWGGLLSLPEMPEPVGGGAELEALLARFAAPFGEVSSIVPLPPFAHAFSHFKLHVKPYRVCLLKIVPFVGQSSRVWVAKDRLAMAPLPSPIKKLLLALYQNAELL
jgi:A/G-specific adenine glycosylase